MVVGLIPPESREHDPSQEDTMHEDRDTMTTAPHSPMKEGDRFICRTCGCQIVLERHGDPDRMPTMQAFTCCCGTTMEAAAP
jgi:hypothetical protein